MIPGLPVSVWPSQSLWSPEVVSWSLRLGGGNRWILVSGWHWPLVTAPSDRDPVMSQLPDCYLHSRGQVSTSSLSLTPLFPEPSTVTVLAVYEISATKLQLMISNIINCGQHNMNESLIVIIARHCWTVVWGEGLHQVHNLLHQMCLMCNDLCGLCSEHWLLLRLSWCR